MRALPFRQDLLPNCECRSCACLLLLFRSLSSSMSVLCAPCALCQVALSRICDFSCQALPGPRPESQACKRTCPWFAPCGASDLQLALPVQPALLRPPAFPRWAAVHTRRISTIFCVQDTVCVCGNSFGATSVCNLLHRTLDDCYPSRSCGGLLSRTLDSDSSNVAPLHCRQHTASLSLSPHFHPTAP